MGWEAAFMLAVLLGVLAGLVKNLPADALIIGAAVLCGLVGILSAEEVFAGFANEGMLTVAALLVVTAALRETGALDILGRYLLGNVRTENGLFGRMALGVTGVSAFLNNTPVVAMLMPILTAWGQKHRISASRLLIPLSYLSILGGTCTLIGTSTNLVVQGMMIEWNARDPVKFAELTPMSMFEIGRVGVPHAIIGILYLYFFGRRLLPDRKDFLEKWGKPRGNTSPTCKSCRAAPWPGRRWHRRACAILKGSS